NDLKQLFDDLSHSEHWVGHSEELTESVAADARSLPAVAQRLSTRYRFEPLRQKLLFMKEKLQATLAGGAQTGPAGSVLSPSGEHVELAYTSPSELRAELELLWRTLRDYNCGASLRSLERMIQTVDIFGFHLAKLDIRQHSSLHAASLDEVCKTLSVLPKGY